jgi:hypothetical protein
MATRSAPLGAATATPGERRDVERYMDWPAIFAGAVLATAISFVLLTFGSAIGLSMASPFESERASPVGFAVAAAIWLVWVQVSSYMAGGYLAGRMRARAHDASEHESDVRDGAHGLVVWGLGVLFSAAVAAVVLTGAASGGARLIGGVAGAGASALGGGGGEASNPTGYVVDSLFRGSRITGAEAEEVRQQVTRILATATARGGISPADRGYLAQTIARVTGMSPPDAERRLTEVLAQAKQAADKARKIGIVAAFLAAAALMVSAAAAWWAAQMGGTHRDEGADFSRVLRRRRARVTSPVR